MEEPEEQKEEPVDFIPERDVFGFPKTTPSLPEDATSEITAFDIKGFTPADNWNRFLAAVIDSMILFIVLSTIGFYFFAENIGKERSHWQNLVNLIVTNLYVGGFISSSWQATPGKKMLELKIIHESGKQVSFWRAVARYFVSAFSFLVFLLGYISIFKDEKRQAWHDMATGTYVVFDKEVNENIEQKDKRGGAYIVVFVLSLVCVFVFMNMVSQYKESVANNEEVRSEDKNKIKEMLKSFSKTEKYADSEFKYVDSVNGFEVVVLKDKEYATGPIPNLFVVDDTNVIKGGDWSRMAYVVSKIPLSKPVTVDAFWGKLRKSDSAKYDITNEVVLGDERGYMVEQANINVKDILFADKPHIGIGRAYIKDSMMFILVIDYMTEEQKRREAKTTEKIFNSFKILK